MKYDIVVIGGGPAGLSTALTARKVYPDKSILVIRKSKKSIIPCAIPYIFGTLKNVDKIVISDGLLEKNDIDLKVDEVKEIISNEKILKLSSGDKIQYDKLVLATGSVPVIPKIEGINLKGVYTLIKDYDYLSNALAWIEESSSVVIIGGGTSGVEIADDLAKTGKEVHLVEMLPHVLMTYFDEEFCAYAEEMLIDAGVKLHTGKYVTKIVGNSRVKKVILSDGSEINADSVIISIGAKPNVELARRSGILVSDYGIIVDSYMQTNCKDIFAVGDCAQRISFLTAKPSKVMLASIAVLAGRIVGSNLYARKLVSKYHGFVGAALTCIRGTAFGTVGFTENEAKKQGLNVITAKAEADDKHPGIFPGTSKIRAKLIVSRDSGIILGAQAVGRTGVQELINSIAVAIYNRVTISEFIEMQIASQPLLTPSPLTFPLVIAGMTILKKLRIL